MTSQTLKCEDGNKRRQLNSRKTGNTNSLSDLSDNLANIRRGSDIRHVFDQPQGPHKLLGGCKYFPAFDLSKRPNLGQKGHSPIPWTRNWKPLPYRRRLCYSVVHNRCPSLVAIQLMADWRDQTQYYDEIRQK